jgi:hypothetical protein
MIQMVGAARDCAEAVRNSRHPDPAALRTLGINDRSLDVLGLSE